MTDYPPNFENLQDFLTISESTQRHRNKIIEMLNAGRAIAFLVTSNFEIHIHPGGLHVNIYRDFPVDQGDQNAIIIKGQISGKSKRIDFNITTTQKDREIKLADLTQLQRTVREKINEFLDLEVYFQ